MRVSRAETSIEGLPKKASERVWDVGVGWEDADWVEVCVGVALGTTEE
jgi:hypothetical protein